MPSNQRKKDIGDMTQSGNTHFLVVAIDNYLHCPKLNNCVKDAQDIIEVLESMYGISIDNEVLPPLFNTEATKKNILCSFRQLAAKVGPQDNVLIYFSGHGEYDKVLEQGYWVPVEAKKGRIDTYIPNSEVRVYLEAIKSLHTFLMVDSCFSGAVFQERSLQRHLLDRSELDPSRWGLTSGRNEIVSDGEAGKNSPFAEGLLFRLKKNTHIMGVDSLCTYVREYVSANSDQLPRGEPLRVKGHKGGIFYFKPIKREPEPTLEETWWKRAIKMNNIEDFKDYLTRYGQNGRFASEAQKSIKQLEAIVWASVQKNHNKEELQNYLYWYPDGRFVKQAQDLLEKLQSISVPQKMAYIPGGTFQMGDTIGDSENNNELPIHEVSLDAFFLGKYTVTFDEFDAYCQATGRKLPNDAGWGRVKRPVINVSWVDAVAYCNWLSKHEGLDPVYSIIDNVVIANRKAKGYRLPTEAEWEYASREGGRSIRFGNGKDIANPKEINYSSTNLPVPYSVTGEYHGKTLPVGSFPPNALNLYEMSGNVWEWCWDWYDPDFYRVNPTHNPEGPPTGIRRIARGGSWGFGPKLCRNTYRLDVNPLDFNIGTGFRIARTI